MALLQDVLLPVKPSSNYDRSQRNRTDVGIGVATPIYCRSFVPGQHISLKPEVYFESYPLLGKLMGSFTCKLAWFWVPQRLYSQQLDQNQVNFNPEDIIFPRFGVPDASEFQNPTNRRAFQNWVTTSVSPNTLLDYIGVAPGSYLYLGPAASGNDYFDYRNRHSHDATPIIGYYDIMRNYYMNTQDKYFYLYGRYGSNGLPSSLDYGLLPYRVSALDRFVDHFVKNPASQALGHGTDIMGVIVDDQPASGENYAYKMNPIYDCCGGVPDPENTGDNPTFGGLFAVNHQPDLFTTYLSSATYQQAVEKTRIVVPTSGENAQNITINQLRYSSHLMDFFERGILAGGRYDDWVESQFGVRTSRSLCIPQILAVNDGRIIFNEVISLAQLDGSTSTNSGLGGKSSVAKGKIVGRRIHVNTTEHGWLMGILTIVPNVSYGQGIKPDLTKWRYTDLYTPSFDRIGFQSLPVPWLRSIPEQYRSQENSEASETRKIAPSAWYDNSIGYQPAWLEYCTATDEVHGSFVPGAGLDYMTITRDFSNPFGTYEGLVYGASAYYGTTVFGQQFNYPFSLLVQDSNKRLCPFWIQAGFDVRVRLNKSKNIMPNIL